MGPMSVVWLFSLFYLCSSTTTHWMVTENGLVQPKEPSQFLMANPFDLLAFLNQDIRWDNFLNLYFDLAARRETINKLWKKVEKETDITSHMAENTFCVLASSLKSLDWFTTNVDEPRYFNFKDQMVIKDMSPNEELPDCKKISSLTFSMFAFEHLKAMANRENLTMTSDFNLSDIVSPLISLEQLGYWLSDKLRENTTSWLHYNMASQYWQSRGNAPKAIECSRRAVLYAPRFVKDIVLYNIGIIFHKSKRTEDALTVLQAGVEHGPQYSTNHFLLANALAVYGDYNSSLKHFNEALRIKPDFELALKHKHGILCHKMLRKKMIFIQRKIKQLQKELIDFIDKESQWVKIQASFLRTMHHENGFDYRNVKKNCEKMAELSGLAIKNLKTEGDKFALIHYFLDDPKFNEEWLQEKGVLAIESAYVLERVVKHLQRQVANIAIPFDKSMPVDSYRLSNGTIRSEIGPPPELLDFMNVDRADLKEFLEMPYSRTTTEKTKVEVENEPFELEGGIVLYPSNMKINRNLEDFDRESIWPTAKFCADNAPRFPKNLEIIYPVFLPFENKGIRLKSLLSGMIGVSLSAEHELPWHPPTCPLEKDAFNAKKHSKTPITVEVAESKYLRVKLLEYVSDGNPALVKGMQDAEIGQRILTAIEAKIAPNWVLYTLASLYWRVRNNKANAANCLISASKSVPPQYRDIVLTSLASVYLEMGYWDDSMRAAEEAFRLGVHEPATNMVLAQLNLARGAGGGAALVLLKAVVRVEPAFLGGAARASLDAAACRHHEHDEEVLQELCTQSQSGFNMVCEQDGKSCRVTAADCGDARSRIHQSELVRLLKSDKTEGVASLSGDVDYSFLREVAYSMPPRTSDKVAHAANYKRMRTIVDTVLRKCSKVKCNNQLTQRIPVGENDCRHQELMMSYWVHMGFKQILTNNKMGILDEISSTVSIYQKEPECSLPDNPTQDYILDRMLKVDALEWEPIMIFIDQLTEAFKVQDFTVLGSKIATYIENNPYSWGALEAAGWWCGASGRGACAVRCLTAAAAHTPRPPRPAALTHPPPPVHAARALTVLLQTQEKLKDAKDMAYLVFYMMPEDQISAYLVALAHTYLEEYEEALWMYRYALSFSETFLAAKVCMHATTCKMVLGDKSTKNKAH